MLERTVEEDFERGSNEEQYWRRHMIVIESQKGNFPSGSTNIRRIKDIFDELGNEYHRLVEPLFNAYKKANIASIREESISIFIAENIGTLVKNEAIWDDRIRNMNVSEKDAENYQYYFGLLVVSDC
ncbi:MAG: hypothetical protein KAT65_03975 [Methanophagales archaeon]|nr:hypothetical protein [Methanophagales archaeon]